MYKTYTDAKQVLNKHKAKLEGEKASRVKPAPPSDECCCDDNGIENKKLVKKARAKAKEIREQAERQNEAEEDFCRKSNLVDQEISKVQDETARKIANIERDTCKDMEVRGNKL